MASTDEIRHGLLALHRAIAKHYAQLIQSSPDVALAHASVVRLLPRAPNA